MSAATTIDLDSQGQPIWRPVLGSRAKRLGALVFDMLLLTVPFALFFAVLEIGLIESNQFETIETLLPKLRFFTFIPLALLYESAFTHKTGQTPGKKVMGIQVVDRAGELLSYPRSLLRACAKGLTFVHSVIWVLNALAVVGTSNRTGIHDELSRSRVIASSSR